MNRSTINKGLIFLLSSLLSFNAAQAGEEEPILPIQIISSSAYTDYKKGITTYTGNVSLSQGSLKIEAKEINIYKDEKGVQKLTAKGAPVRLTQQPLPDKPPITAEADQINYDVLSEMLTLNGHVYIKLEESIHRGAHYQYNLSTQTLKASGNAENRIITTFQPRK